MASVTIDIPGIGNVEAKNAATEATLKEILKALKGGGGRGGKSGAGGGAAGAGAGGGSAGGGGPASQLQKSSNNINKYANNLGVNLKNMGQNLEGLGQSFGSLLSPLGKLPGASLAVGKSFINLAERGTQLISDLANVGDSLTAAAGTLRHIPVVGGLLSTVLGAVAEASEKTAKSFKSAASVGASFGGSLNNFSKSASQAGMTMDQYGDFIRKNGQSLLGLGSTTEEGAKRFSTLSKTLRATSSDLYALGYGTEEINQGLANYSGLLRLQGQQGKRSNSELIAGTKNYLKEMDALAKATGLERAAIEEKFKRTMEDAQFASFMAGRNADMAKSFGQLISRADAASPELAGLIKDFVATGSFTNAENAKTASTMGEGFMSALRELRQKALRNETVSAAESDRIFKQMAASSDSSMKRLGSTLAATGGEFDHSVKSHIGLQKLSGTSLQEATEAQNEAAAATDGQLQAIEQAKAKLAEFSNSFTMALVNSGALGLLLSTFQALANFTMNIVLPAFNVLIGVLAKVWNGFTMLLMPVVDFLKSKFEGFGGTLGFIDSLMNTVFTVLDGAVRGVILVLEGLFTGIQTLVDPLVRLKDAVFGTGDGAIQFGDILISVGSLVGQALEHLATFIGFLIDNAIIPVVNAFKEYLWPAIKTVAEFIGNNLFEILTVLGATFLALNAASIIRNTIELAGNAVLAVKNGLMLIATTGLTALSAGLASVTWPIMALVAIVTGIVVLFRHLYKTGWSFGDVLEAIGDNFKGLMLKLAEGILFVLDKITFGDANTAIKDAQKAVEARQKELQDREKDRDQRRQARAAERADDKQEKSATEQKYADLERKHKEGLRHDSKKFAEQKITDTKLGGLAQQNIDTKKAQLDAEKKNNEQANKNYTDSLALLKDEAKAQKSNLVPPDKKQSQNVAGMAVTQQEQQRIAQAEATRRQLESDAEKKRQDAAKLAASETERKQKEEADRKAGKPGSRAPATQESAESLLASLNNKMDKLISLNIKITETADRQLTVQQSFSGDLFRA